MVQNDSECVPYERLKNFGCEDCWHWSSKYRSKEAWIYGSEKKTVCFHPNWSNGTAGIMGTTAINKGTSKYRFWEIQISDRIFGTSTMFGIGTRKACLHKNSFVNLIGLDANSWGLSHKGSIYHNGRRQQFCRPFRENEPTRIGMLYDNQTGNLSYYKDGVYIGIAFTNLNEIKENLYPIISSTAAKTEIVLKSRRREFQNLQERCKTAIIVNYRNELFNMLSVKLPLRLLNYIQSESNDEDDEDSDYQLDEEDNHQNISSTDQLIKITEDDSDQCDDHHQQIRANCHHHHHNHHRDHLDNHRRSPLKCTLETLHSSIRTFRRRDEYFF